MRASNYAEIVRFENVSLDYLKGQPVFYDLNFTFCVGEFYFLTGPSGAGKTSLLKLIYRDLKPSSGSVYVFGRNVLTLSKNELPEFRQRMGLVFQDCRLLDHLTATQNVAVALKIAGMDETRAYVYAEELLHWVGLGDYLRSYPTSLSDGQKQRIAIARAVIARPLLLLADEPTGNVDDQAAFRLMNLFEELNKIGTTIILATHHKNLVSSFSYPEIHLNDGYLSTPFAAMHHPHKARA